MINEEASAGEESKKEIQKMTLKKSGFQPDFFVVVGYGRLIKPGTIKTRNRNGRGWCNGRLGGWVLCLDL